MEIETPVCVTGASGFIAAHIVRELLERGYRVRGTVRSLADPDKYRYLTSLPGAAERLELVEAELTTEGSFDEAVKGCRVVIHTASPYVIDVEDPQRDLVDPAVSGTLNVLRSAKDAGAQRVVLTSSMAAISDEPRDDHVFTEADWNERSSLTRNPYYFSKAEAERAAWRFVEEQSPGFDLVVINPYMVLGPSLGPSLNTTNQLFRDILQGVYPGIMSLSWGFVDVRDVARAHVLAMETDEASGRYLCAGEEMDMKTLVGVLKEAGYDRGFQLPRMDLACSVGDFAARLMSYTQPKGTGSYLRTHLGKRMRYDNAKIRRELGMEFRPAKDAVLDAVEDLFRHGHLERPAGATRPAEA
ncbi:MAG TPA: aldehyde reductase [Sandaracinaceae bacterium LLY-WYZ-13_1]|nr:aldehyde reductase [Sandaracinaceae bacterium LLY-WYZ-13_1]